MDESVLSSAWYRVAELKPRLVSPLQVTRHVMRDQVWHVLVEPASGRQLRLNPQAYGFAGRCDGSLTVDQIWHQLMELHGDDAPSQDEVLRLLAQLMRLGTLQFDSAPQLSMLFARRAEEGARKRRAAINPLALRLRLLDPTRLLDWLEPRLRFLGRGAFVAWGLMVLAAAIGCLVNWGEIRADGARLLAGVGAFWIAWICYPLTKALHELAHAVAVRRMGGQVHELGISLMFLTPAPYVDASAANAFPRASQRALVSAAGILVELGMAALAAFVWLLVQPGLVRDVAFVLMSLCSLSTLLFNGNPLLRLDGYHVLCDLLELPNLAQRSQAWWRAQWRRFTWGGAASAPMPSLAQGERKWLVGYAPLSLAYRVVLLGGIVLWLGARAWLLGVLAAGALAVWLAMWVARAMRDALDGPVTPRARARAMGTVAAIVFGGLLLLFAIPVPHPVVARGVVWPPDRAQLRPEAAGFVRELRAGGGEAIPAGASLAVLEDAVLVSEREKLASRLSALYAQQYQALLSDPARAGDVAQDIERTRAELARADEQLDRLQVRAASSGRLVLPHESDLEGSFVARGAMLGYVVTGQPPMVRVALTEENAALVRRGVRTVEARLPGSGAAPAKLAAEVPAATRQLPHAALGDRQGGPVPVDAADRDGLRTSVPVFLLDVALQEESRSPMGSRAWVRFDLAWEPIGVQWARRLRQLLLKQFQPGGQV